ncbi:MAG: hypothetical protein ACI4RF_08880 [Eubacterium sp.]
MKALTLSVMSSLAISVTNGTYKVDDEVRERLNNPIVLGISQIKSAINDPDYSDLFFVILAFIAQSKR